MRVMQLCPNPDQMDYIHYIYMHFIAEPGGLPLPATHHELSTQQLKMARPYITGLCQI